MIAIVRIFALIVLIATVAAWVALGSNFGWTKTSVQEMKIDPVTEIEYPGPIQETFIPGFEFLALGVGSALVLFGVTLLVPHHKPKNP